MYSVIFPFDQSDQTEQTTWETIEQAKDYVGEIDRPAAIKNDQTDTVVFMFFCKQWISVN